MPLDRLVLILFCIVALAGAAIWVISLIMVSSSLHPLLSLIPIAATGIMAYILIRVVTDRTGSAEDDHYDKMEH